MGLGKTVELLALVLANRFQGPSPTFDSAGPAAKRRRRERVECVCGATHSAPASEGGYAGLWLCCDECDAWAHGACVGFPRRAPPGERDGARSALDLNLLYLSLSSLLACGQCTRPAAATTAACRALVQGRGSAAAASGRGRRPR